MWGSSAHSWSVFMSSEQRGEGCVSQIISPPPGVVGPLVHMFVWVVCEFRRREGEGEEGTVGFFASSLCFFPLRALSCKILRFREEPNGSGVGI